MQIKKLASLILSMLGEERRRIVSDWRFLILARRSCLAHHEPIPDKQKVSQVIKHLQRQHHLVSIKGVQGVFRIEVPYASTVEFSEEQLVQECNPTAMLSHFTALVHHGLTDQIPNQIFATHYEGNPRGRIPLGTMPEDWVEHSIPNPKFPSAVYGVSIIWTRTKPEWDFGVMTSFVGGLPVYVTNLERTILDALRSMSKAGGESGMFQAWNRATERMEGERLIAYTERFSSPLLRQRVGYLLDQLQIPNPRRAVWQQDLKRGGSLKLIPSRDYAPTYSEEWNLSINATDAQLAELSG